MKTASGYADTLARLRQTAIGWKVAALALALAATAEGFALYSLINKPVPTVLIPYGMDLKDKGVSVPSLEYLGLVARADLSMLLDWTPLTVRQQLRAFRARLAPALWSRLKGRLEEEARRYRADRVAQAFHITKLDLTGPYTVRALGVIERYVVGRRILEMQVRYTITYQHAGGRYLIANLNVETLDGKKQAQR